MSREASDLIKRNNNRVLFAAKVIQQTAFINGIKITTRFEGGSRGAMSYDPNYYSAINGAYETTAAEQSAYIASVPRLPEPPAPPPAGPTLQYDPSVSTSYPGTGTTVNNIGSYGTLSGTMTNVTYNAAVKGGVFTFGGSGYISFPTYDFGPTMTVIVWINPTSVPPGTINTILANGVGGGNASGFKLFWNSWTTNDRRVIMEAGTGTTGGEVKTAINTIDFATWQQLAFVFDKVNRTLVIYKNGLAVAAESSSIVANIPMNQAFRIGAFMGNVDYYYANAQLGSIKIYSRLLSATEVLADYNSTSSRFA
jgi:hypothetical protein